jgi:hypothetical protein
MGQPKPFSTPQTPASFGRQPIEVSFAQPEERPMLKLHTVGLANRAHLEEDHSGQVRLHFRGLQYGVEDPVPPSLIRSRTAVGITAGEFVGGKMLRRHGYDEQGWPDLARRFLLTFTARQAAMD